LSLPNLEDSDLQKIWIDTAKRNPDELIYPKDWTIEQMWPEMARKIDICLAGKFE
jgi:hypothetical protein